MRDAARKWHAILSEECPSALAGADYDAFAAAVSVVHSRTYGVAGEKGEGYFRALLPLADLLNHAGDEYAPEASFSRTSPPTPPTILPPLFETRRCGLPPATRTTWRGARWTTPA